MPEPASSSRSNGRSRLPAPSSGRRRNRLDLAPMVLVGVVLWACTALLAGLVVIPLGGGLAAAFAVAALTPVVVFMTVALFQRGPGFHE